MSSDALTRTELIASIECYSIFSASKKKKSFIRLVHVPVTDYVRKPVSLVHSPSFINGTALRKSSAAGLTTSPAVYCGANLELYECLRLGKRKLIHIFNIAHMTDVAVQRDSPSKKKSHNDTVLDVCFGNISALKLLFAKSDDGHVWCDRLNQISAEVAKLFSWQQNPVFTENSAYMGAYGVTVISEIPGIDLTATYELKILFECIIMKKLDELNEVSETANSVVMYWAITSIKRFGLHSTDNHVFSIEYVEPDSDSNEPVCCVFRSAYAISLVNQIDKRVKTLNKVDIENVYSEVEKRNRISHLGEIKAARSNQSLQQLHEEDDNEEPRERKPVTPARNYLESAGVIYSSFSVS